MKQRVFGSGMEAVERTYRIVSIELLYQFLTIITGGPMIDVTSSKKFEETNCCQILNFPSSYHVLSNSINMSS